MSDIAGNENAVMSAETEAVQVERSVLTDLVMEGLNVQISPSLQDGFKDTANDRAIAYRDRILEAAGRSKETE